MDIVILAIILDLEHWVSSGGAGTSVPIAAKVWGSFGTTEIHLEMDYQNFFVVSVFFLKIINYANYKVISKNIFFYN